MEIKGRSIFVTGAAGFIGANIVSTLLKTNSQIRVIGLDNMSEYYDVRIKEYRLQQINSLAKMRPQSDWLFIKGSISDCELMNKIFNEYHPTVVINMAAQAGVRYSIVNPDVYIKTNILGFYNILEACRHSYDSGKGVEHLVYASSSSVYGESQQMPYRTEDKTDSPVSLYAATKKSNELLAFAYAKLYGIPTTGLRFFTVYGPAGRPDMAYFKFANKLCQNQKISIFNYGKCQRDFTYIDDIVEGVRRVIEKPPKKSCNENDCLQTPHRVYNIGNSHPESLLDFVNILQQELVQAGALSSEFDIEKHMELLPMQPGDVESTYADTSALERDFGFKPNTPLREGLRQFAEWYSDFYMRGGWT